MLAGMARIENLWRARTARISRFFWIDAEWSADYRAIQFLGILLWWAPRAQA